MSSQLEKLNQKIEESYQTLPLVSKKEDLVPGEGKVGATIMMIGEAPGFHESVQRRPFVGRSGQLLRKTFAEIGLTAGSIYISNIVKARPPENRDPTPEEILAFKPFLDEEIEILSPKLIVTLGRFSLNKFLPTVRISSVHGRLHKIDWNKKTRFVLPMYHPAAALRGTQIKNQFVADFAKIPKILAWIDGQTEHLAMEEEIKNALW